MKTNTQYTPLNDLALLLVGPPLSGKTNVAMSFPDPYFISTDHKLNNAVTRFPGKKFFYDFGDVDTETGVAIPADKRWNRMVELIKTASKDPDIKTIVIDNMTDVAAYLIDHIIAAGGSKLVVGGEKVMQIEHWQPFMILMTRLIVALKSTNKFIVVCAHELVEKDEISGTLTYRPSVPGRLRDTLGAYFTDVWRTETETTTSGTVYRVRTAPTARMSLGTQFALPANFVFTWPEFEKAMKGTK